MIRQFDFAATPRLYFGPGKRSVLTGVIKSFGKKVLLVRGAGSFDASRYGKEILHELKSHFDVASCEVSQEPTPAIIDSAVAKFRGDMPHVVLGIGGGSALDAAKAISAMLPVNESVVNFLEGVGTKTHPGSKVPFIAMPTTSGTGSEATKNAVLSEVGENGFKRSLRHHHFVPDVAIIDPALTMSCPRNVTAASGMDAFTQLLESYLSTSSNPMTDALALEGLTLISRSLRKSYQYPDDIETRTDMALAAYLSGITLANAGLGLVHGFASSLGGRYPIPHGVICSTLMPAANMVTLRKLQHERNGAALQKYERAGKLFSGSQSEADSPIECLMEFIAQSAAEMQIPKLNDCGVSRDEIKKIAAGTDNKYNPVHLDVDERIEVLELSM